MVWTSMLLARRGVRQRCDDRLTPQHKLVDWGVRVPDWPPADRVASVTGLKRPSDVSIAPVGRGGFCRRSGA